MDGKGPDLEKDYKNFVLSRKMYATLFLQNLGYEWLYAKVAEASAVNYMQTAFSSY